MSEMIADWLLSLLGHPDGEIDAPADKWPTILADITDISIPFILVLLFLLPFLIVKFRKKKFTPVTAVACVVIGGALAYSGWWLNEWSYGYGQGVIFNEIYGD